MLKRDLFRAKEVNMKLAVSGAHFRYHVVLSKQCMRLWCLVSSHTWPCNEDVCVCVSRVLLSGQDDVPGGTRVRQVNHPVTRSVNQECTF